MSLKNLFHKTNEQKATSACGTACGTGDKKPVTSDAGIVIFTL